MIEKMLNHIYNKHILNHAANITKIGTLENPDAIATARAKLCGSEITVYINVKNGTISEFKQNVKACVFGQATAAIMAQNAIGEGIEEIREIKNIMWNMLKYDGAPPKGKWQTLAQLQCVRDLPPRHDSTMLIFNAVYEALSTIKNETDNKIKNPTNNKIKKKTEN